MSKGTRTVGRRPAKAVRGTATLRRLLANSEAYGVGLARPGCLHALGEAGSER